MDRCPKCGKDRNLVGRAHNCRPPEAASVPVTGPTPKPKFGDAVNIPISEMPARGIGPMVIKAKREPLAAQGAGPASGKPIKSSRGGGNVGKHGQPHQNPGDGAGDPEAVKHRPASPRETKFRAKPGTATYTGQYRDPDKRRASQRALMKKRRAKEPA